MAQLVVSANLAALLERIDPRLNFPEQRLAGHGSLSADCTFPDYKGSPAEGLVGLAKVAVPLFGAGNFSPPEFGPGCWPFEKMAVMAMPEAPVDKHHNLSPRHYYVGLTGKVFIVQSVAITPGVQSFSYCQLRLGILTLYTGHHLRSLSFVYNIDHRLGVVAGQESSWLFRCDSKPNMLIL